MSAKIAICCLCGGTGQSKVYPGRCCALCAGRCFGVAAEAIPDEPIAPIPTGTFRDQPQLFYLAAEDLNH